MRLLSWLCPFSLAAVAISVSANAAAASVEIYDRFTGTYLPSYSFKGRLYVQGEPGHEYEIRIRNDGARRVLAVTTVDGVNVITGQTGAVNQSGYVLDPYGNTSVEGWRKSMERTAAFYFTKLPDSYAARTGRPDNVGVIGVAIFREKVACCRWDEDLRESARNESQGRRAQSPPAPRERAADASEAAKAESKLGTGHGRGEYSAARYTEFERASSVPDETIVIYYDSHRNLMAQGIIPSPRRYADKLPRAFPNGFVPDP